jgi:hypothetical protein
MKRIDSMLLKVFLYGLPAVIAFAAFSYFYSLGVVNHVNVYLNLLNSFSGLVFALWMTLSLYLSVRLMFSGPFRDQVIARLTFIRERDEREAILTGKATRTTFLTSLAILIFLFCLSCFQVSIYRLPPERAVDGKTGIVSLGLGFNLFEHSRQDRPRETIEKKDIFSYTGLPVSSTTVILMLIVWQIISYNFSMRRLTKVITR